MNVADRLPNRREITPADVARALRITKASVYRHIRAGRLPAFHLRGQRYVADRVELARVLQQLQQEKQV